MKNPDVEDASYTHAADYYDGRDAGAMIRYLWRRPESKQDPAAGGWHSIPKSHRLGNARSFAQAADERTAAVWRYHRRKGTDIGHNRASWAASYVHIVISPAARHELRTDQLAELAQPWITDEYGRELAHVGAIHTDGRTGPHLHLAIARDRFGRDELAGLQSATRGLSREMVQELEMVREMAQERETSHELEL